MPTSYTTSLGLALPADNELGGTWGQVVNAFITTYLDAAIAGAQTISGSQTAVTLTKTTGLTLSQAGATATGSAQYSIINCTGNPASLLTITAPAASKVYLVINSTSTSQQVKIVGAGPTTGVTLISGERALVAWNGSDFVKVSSFPSVTGLTANRLLYGSAVGEIAQSAGLTFDGTNFATTGTASATKIIPTGGTAAGTGMYLSAANTISMSTNSLESLRIDGAGALTVRGPTVTTSVVFNDPSLGATNNYINLPATNTVAVSTNNVERLRINASGNVGIGTTSPVNKLDVNGSFGRGAPVTKTASFTLADNENWVVIYSGSTVTITFPAASAWTGREIMLKNLSALVVNSSTSNIVSFSSTSPSNFIFSSGSVRCATLVSDGTNWVVMQQGL
jgi:hypothetical protein